MTGGLPSRRSRRGVGTSGRHVSRAAVLLAASHFTTMNIGCSTGVSTGATTADVSNDSEFRAGVTPDTTATEPTQNAGGSRERDAELSDRVLADLTARLPSIFAIADLRPQSRSAVSGLSVRDWMKILADDSRSRFPAPDGELAPLDFGDVDVPGDVNASGDDLLDAHRAYARGIDQLAAARFDKAAGHLRRAAMLRPSDGTVLERLAEALERGGKPADAEPIRKRLLALDPAHESTCFARAIQSLRAGDESAAAGWFARVRAAGRSHDTPPGADRIAETIFFRVALTSGADASAAEIGRTLAARLVTDERAIGVDDQPGPIFLVPEAARRPGMNAGPDPVDVLRDAGDAAYRAERFVAAQEIWREQVEIARSRGHVSLDGVARCMLADVTLGDTDSANSIARQASRQLEPHAWRDHAVLASIIAWANSAAEGDDGLGLVVPERTRSVHSDSSSPAAITAGTNPEVFARVGEQILRDVKRRPDVAAAGWRVLGSPISAADIDAVASGNVAGRAGADESLLIRLGLSAMLDIADCPARAWDVIGPRGREQGTAASHDEDAALHAALRRERVVVAARVRHEPSLRPHLVSFTPGAPIAFDESYITDLLIDATALRLVSREIEAIARLEAILGDDDQIGSIDPGLVAACAEEFARLQGIRADDTAPNPPTDKHRRAAIDTARSAWQLLRGANELQTRDEQLDRIARLLFDFDRPGRPGSDLRRRGLTWSTWLDDRPDSAARRQAGAEARLEARIASPAGLAADLGAAMRRLARRPGDAAAARQLTLIARAANLTDVAAAWVSTCLAETPLDPVLRRTLLALAPDRQQQIIDAAATGDADVVAVRLQELAAGDRQDADARLALLRPRIARSPQSPHLAAEWLTRARDTESFDDAVNALAMLTETAADATDRQLLTSIGDATMLGLSAAPRDGESDTAEDTDNAAARAALDLAVVRLAAATSVRPVTPSAIHAAAFEAAGRQRVSANDADVQTIANAFATQTPADDSTVSLGALRVQGIGRRMIAAGRPDLARVALAAKLEDGNVDGGLANVLTAVLSMLDASEVVLSDSLAALNPDTPAVTPSTALSRLKYRLDLLESRGMLANFGGGVGMTPEEASDLNQVRKEVAHTIGTVYAVLNQPDAALAFMEWAWELDDQDAALANDLGYGRLEAGDLAGARGPIEFAVPPLDVDANGAANAGEEDEDRPFGIRNAAGLDSRGWLRYHEGELDGPDGAIALLEAAALGEVDPSPERLLHLGDARWRTGDKLGALTAWQEALTETRPGETPYGMGRDSGPCSTRLGARRRRSARPV